MPLCLHVRISLATLAAGLCALTAGCAGSRQVAAAPEPAPETPKFDLPPAAPPPGEQPEVMLGIDVLEAAHFSAIAGKKIGLLTHAAGVNRRGESTIDVLRRAPNARLVALFAPEHGLDGSVTAGANFSNGIHKPTGLPVYSLYGKTRKPTPSMLRGIDALVIDLQDIGSRSYTFVSAMRYAIEACFENGVEVIVLDRPNPLGGLKVSGPPLDAEWVSYVGAFRVPYVHGLTIGELARMAKEAPGVLAVSDRVRQRGRLSVVPMGGWHRSMRWPDTGLKWVPTSPNIPDFNAVAGYAMVGMGCQMPKTWSWGIGGSYHFRGIGYPRRKADEIIAELSQYHIPGINLVKAQGIGSDGKPVTGVYVEISDWDAWNPTELSFYMMKTAAKWSPLNPFLVAPTEDKNFFNKIVGSNAWFKAITTQGASVDVNAFIKNWSARDAVYQQQSRRYWIYR